MLSASSRPAPLNCYPSGDLPIAGAPKLTQDQIDLAQRLYDAGEHTVSQIASILEVPSTTVC